MKGAILFFILSSTGIYYIDIFITINPPNVITQTDFSFKSNSTIPLVFRLPSGLPPNEFDSLVVLSGEKILRYLPFKPDCIRFVAELGKSSDIRIITKHSASSAFFSLMLNNFVGTNDTIKYLRITVLIPTSLGNFRSSIPFKDDISDKDKRILCTKFENGLPDTILSLSW